MKLKIFFVILITSIAGLNISAQTDPEITVTLLANDKIADVNIDQGKYIKNVGQVIDLMKTEFKEYSKDQMIAVLIVSHKSEKPTVEIYSKPKINADKEQHFLNSVNSLQFENTRLVDFPILLSLNIKNGDLSGDFKNVVLPTQKIKDDYEKADLKKKYDLNKSWATSQVLPVLAAYETIVDDKFLGVKNFGSLVTKTNFSENQNITKLTSNNSDYWRATLEMSVGNQLIPVTKIFMLISQGELDYAMKYLEIVQLFSDPKTIPNDYLKELSWRLKLFNQQLQAEIGNGIAEHDKGNYEIAISTYKSILNDYPNSAWTLYESYYSQNALDTKDGKGNATDRSDWDDAKIKIFKANPLYNMDVRASNGKEGYLLFRRQEINSLFKSNDERISDIYKYADISMDLGVYDFAAQLFWYSYIYGKDNKKALNRFLYCLEKLGVTDIKQNFKGDFEKEFKKIDNEKEKEMTKSAIYKAFKK
jgi:tetratricopeptide (TPR) repeat protein